MNDYEKYLNELIANYPTYDYVKIKRKPKKKIDVKETIKGTLFCAIVIIFMLLIACLDSIAEMI